MLAWRYSQKNQELSCPHFTLTGHSILPVITTSPATACHKRLSALKNQFAHSAKNCVILAFLVDPVCRSAFSLPLSASLCPCLPSATAAFTADAVVVCQLRRRLSLFGSWIAAKIGSGILGLAGL